MKFSWFLGLIVASAVFASCSNGKKPGASFSSNQPILKGQDDTAKVDESMRATTFKTVNISNASSVEIILHPDSACKVRKLSSQAYQVTAPSLEGIKIDGCGKLHVSGKNPKCSHFDIDLQRVSIAQIDPLLSADKIDVNIQGVTFSHIRVNCQDLHLSAHLFAHIKLMGKAVHVTYDVDKKKQIDDAELKRQ